MEKRCRDKNCQRQKTLEQGRVVCYTGLDGHRDTHRKCVLDTGTVLLLYGTRISAVYGNYMDCRQ